jgi:hypothetical protein
MGFHRVVNPLGHLPLNLVVNFVVNFVVNLVVNLALNFVVNFVEPPVSATEEANHRVTETQR